MPAVTIKNLPDGLYQRLKTNARAHHRSLIAVAWDLGTGCGLRIM
ncbi:FitA-like ribbon-helix-helix domain-containing protein [Thiohalocapsa halophila]|nr:hypothetical protein [Thiohalocapsa halophila]